MKIVHVITRADTIGGGQQHVLDVSTALIERGHSLLAVTGPRGPFTDALETAGVPTLPLDSLGSKMSMSADKATVRSLVKILHDESADVLACHSTKAGILGRIAGYRAKIPTVYTLHGLTFSPGTSPIRRLPAWALELAMRPLGAHVIAVSKFDGNLALRARVVKPSKLHVVQNSIVDQALSNGPAPGNVLVMIARFEPQKDHETLFRALATNLDLDWTLVLLGDGSGMDVARALAVELNIAERVRFEGLVDDVRPHLEGALAFVLSTNYEGLPLSILESLSCGLPVVATNVGGVNEAVIHGENGFLVNRRDATDLASALRQLLTDPELVARMSKASRSLYERDFNFPAFIDATYAVYESAVLDR